MCLSKCEIVTDIHLKTLADNCTMLQKLELYDCKQLTDTGLLKIATNCTYLRELSLDTVPICDKLLVQLSFTCLSLSSLCLSNCTGVVSKVGMIALGERCTLLRVVYITYCYVDMSTTLDDIRKRRIYPHLHLKIYGHL